MPSKFLKVELISGCSFLRFRKINYKLLLLFVQTTGITDRELVAATLRETEAYYI
jgi:hypothetical protein